MKKTLIEKIPIILPESIAMLTDGARIYDSSSSPEARVYFIDCDGGYYLKRAAKGSLQREATMTEYFHKKGLGAEVLEYTTDEYDLLLTRAAVGDDCTAAKYLDEPKRLADVLAEGLRALHEINPSDCPVTDRCGEYIALAEANYRSGCYSKEHFPDSFGYRSAEDAYSALQNGKAMLKNEVLIHGDYCLPNIMLDGWRLSGFIDLGNGGIGDRHIDLFWGEWSVCFNLRLYNAANPEKYATRFLDAYGRDIIDTDILRTVAAAEVFG